ncbi:MAG TPA: hypothetical protein VM099_01845 [Gemmatimonadaceae bacterium]|nr:hypothetical protein [Gemmatimonadaceae bacterium]
MSSAAASPPAAADNRVGKFLIKSLLLGLAIIVTGILVSQYDTRGADNNYLAAVLEKDRLIRNTPSPKIILVGGSNLAFGVDSKLLQDSLGLPVVNMGLYAKLGLRYMLAQVKPYVHAGDVVVVVPEYDQFYGQFSEGDNTLNTALLYAPRDRIPDFVRSYSVVDVVLRPRVENARRSFLTGVADLFGVKNKYFPPDTNPVYNRHSFNAYGDAVSHLGKTPENPDSIFVKPHPPPSDFSRKALSELNDIGDIARERTAHPYFMFPSYLDRAYAINVESIAGLRTKLEREMRLPILGSAQEFIYPGKWFFDTRYHLNEIGRDVRTMQMVQLLRAARKTDGW